MPEVRGRQWEVWGLKVVLTMFDLVLASAVAMVPPIPILLSPSLQFFLNFFNFKFVSILILSLDLLSYIFSVFFWVLFADPH